MDYSVSEVEAVVLGSCYEAGLCWRKVYLQAFKRVCLVVRGVSFNGSTAFMSPPVFRLLVVSHAVDCVLWLASLELMLSSLDIILDMPCDLAVRRKRLDECRQSFTVAELLLDGHDFPGHGELTFDLSNDQSFDQAETWRKADFCRG